MGAEDADCRLSALLEVEKNKLQGTVEPADSAGMCNSEERWDMRLNRTR